MKPNWNDLDPFLKGYLEAVFWTNDEDVPSGDYALTGRAEEHYKRLDQKSFEQARQDCLDFVEQANEKYPGALDLLEPDRGGHDFWLTRCGHGCGFWDRDLGEAGDQLTDLANSFGERWANNDPEGWFID